MGRNGVVVVALLVVLGLVAWMVRQRLSAFSDQSSGEVISSQSSVVSGTTVSVEFADESESWDWAVTCTEPLARFLNLPGPLLVTLSDDPADLPLGAAYPDADNPTALAVSGCEEVGEGLACRVAIQRGEPSPTLDVAVTVATAYAAAEALDRRSEAEWENRPAWAWSRYEPLIALRQEGWVSACLSVE